MENPVNPTAFPRQDTRTPVTWAIAAVAINVPLMAWLVGPMGVEGLALALSISAVLEVLGLLWSLHRRIDSVEGAAILRSLGRAAIAGVASALFMLGGLTVVEASLGGLLDQGQVGQRLGCDLAERVAGDQSLGALAAP